MSFTEQLMVDGVKYPTPELADRARREQEVSAQTAQARRVKLAQSFEAELRERYLATGATEADWQQQKASIIAKAREAATLHHADVARAANRARYGD